MSCKFRDVLQIVPRCSANCSEMFCKLLWFFVNFSFRTRSCSFVSLRNTIMEQFVIVLSWNFVNICTFISKNEHIFWWTYVLHVFLKLVQKLISHSFKFYWLFSKKFKCSFCGGVSGDLKPKRLCGLFSGSSFSLPKQKAFHLNLFTKFSTFSIIHFK